MSAGKVIPPVVIASGVWYGLLVYLGALAGRNLGAILDLLDSINTVLVVVAAVLLAGIGIWWWRTRHPREEP